MSFPLTQSAMLEIRRYGFGNCRRSRSRRDNADFPDDIPTWNYLIFPSHLSNWLHIQALHIPQSTSNLINASSLAGGFLPLWIFASLPQITRSGSTVLFFFAPKLVFGKGWKGQHSGGLAQCDNRQGQAGEWQFWTFKVNYNYQFLWSRMESDKLQSHPNPFLL